MQLEDYLDFQGPDVIRIKGHRIGIEHIVERYREGFSPEQIAQDFPGLSLEKIYAIITYYLHNQATIDAYVARVNTEYERRMREYDAEEPSPAVKRLRVLQAQKVSEHQA